MDLNYLWRRPEGDPLPLQPLHVRSVADRTFTAWQQECACIQHYHKIQWCVSDWAEIRFAGRVYRLEAGQVAHYPPDVEHWARAGADGWRSCWLTFVPGISDVFFAGFGIEKFSIFNAGPCPVEDFALILKTLSEIDRLAERAAGVLAYQLLAKVADTCAADNRDSAVDQALRLMQSHWADPAFSIEDLAQRCRVHRSQLSRMFVKQVGVAPSRYLMRLRLQQASLLLIDGTLCSNDIAAQCGFVDGSYFARVFRKA